MKVLELFGGIGACSNALRNLNIDFEVVDYVEIDKYAVKSYNAIYDTNFETQDITKWDKDIEVDLIMHGSPCQDFSLAGKQAGGDEGSGTRSSLMYETLRIVEKLKPKYVIWENVKNILSKKHKHNFDAYLAKMECLGYVNYYQILNAKDYGIPQNRERVFTVSILDERIFKFPLGNECDNKINRLFNFSARQDCRVVYNSNGLSPTLVAGMGAGGGKVPMFIENFQFPSKEELKLKLKNLLEDEVDEKYYISEKMINGFIKHNENHKQKGTGFIWKPKSENDIASTLRANAALCPTDNTIKCVQEGNLQGGKWDKINESCRRVYSENGISPTIHTCQGGNTEPKVMTKFRIRKLTPKECWRLMGFNDEDFEKAEKVNSNTQLYKQAGNSIVVNILEAILKELF